MAIVRGTNNSEVLDKLDGVTEGNDTVFGMDGNDVIQGLGGNDTLKGGGGADQLWGGAGSDWADYSDSPDGVRIELVSGTGYGGSAEGDFLNSIENVAGSGYTDILYGNGVANNLRGDSGNDHLTGRGGADVLDGGVGIDSARYDDSPAGVTVSLLAGTAHYGDAEGDTFISIENLFGSTHDDVLIGNDVNNGLHGGEGADILKGYGGNDYLNGAQGADTMVGGTGDDAYEVGSAQDAVVEFAGEGWDMVYVPFSYVMPENVEELVLAHGVGPINATGNSSGNEILGNESANQIDGGGGIDTMYGYEGNDIYFVDSRYDNTYEMAGEGLDEVRTSVSYRLTWGSDVENLRTTDDDGVAAIDLTGNSSGNVVRGNNGANVLNGGGGTDELTGRGGHDAFLFNTALGGGNVDVITDFDVASDTIWLDQDIFSSSLGLGNIANGEFVIGTAAQDANDRIIYDSGTGALFYDADGNGASAAIQFATLSPNLALTHQDFLVV